MKSQKRLSGSVPEQESTVRERLSVTRMTGKSVRLIDFGMIVSERQLTLRGTNQFAVSVKWIFPRPPWDLRAPIIGFYLEQMLCSSVADVNLLAVQEPRGSGSL